MTMEKDLGASTPDASPAQSMPEIPHLEAAPVIQMNMPNVGSDRNRGGQPHLQDETPDNNGSSDNVEGLIHSLLNRLDDNDRRYGVALENLNQRLDELGEKARDAGRTAPAQSVPALNKVRKKASTLAEHVSAAEEMHRAQRSTSPQDLAQKVSSIADHMDDNDPGDNDPRFSPHPGPALNNDFADVTKRLENSLAARTPANEFAYLAKRMDDLANRFDTALNSQNNVQALETIESQLNTLTENFSGAHQQHARIEAMESHLHNLMDWVQSADTPSGQKDDVRFDAIEQAIKALNDNALEMDSRTAGMLETMNATLRSLSESIDAPSEISARPKHTHSEAPQEDYPEVWIGDESDTGYTADILARRLSAEDPNRMGATIPDYQPAPGQPGAFYPESDPVEFRDDVAAPPEEASAPENDFIASAHRAAAAADAQEAPASPLKADKQHFPGYEETSTASGSKRQRPLLVMAAVGLLLVSAGLLYSRLKTTSITSEEAGSAQMTPEHSSSSSASSSSGTPSATGEPAADTSKIKSAGDKKQHSGRMPTLEETRPSEPAIKPVTAPVARVSHRTPSTAIAAQATQTLTEPNFNQQISTATVLASMPRNTGAGDMSGVSVTIKEASTGAAPNAAAPALVPQGNTMPAKPMAQPRRAPLPAISASATPAAGSSGLDSAPANETLIRSNDIATAMPPAIIGPQSLRMAAARGNPAAQVEVASRYAKGSGVKQNLEKAVEWFGRAAAQGHAPAQYRLAALHERGKGVKQDIGLAQTWYRRAAELGHVRAMHNLAVLYTRPEGKRPDYVTAKLWFYQGAKYGLADSQFNLGILYERGLGAKKNAAEAYKWFTLAARQGDKGAVKRRELIRPRLSASALSAVEQTLKSWKAVPVKQAANRTGPPKGGWQNALTENTNAGSDPALIARAQYLLNKLGYDAGLPDGKMGPKTTAAIRKFEVSTGKTKTGRVTPVLLRRLAVLSG